MENLKLNKIILNDNSCLQDLVYLEKPATEEEITLIINGAMATVKCENGGGSIGFEVK